MTGRNVFFERPELDRILRFYGRMVAAGEWRDYAMDFGKDAAVFSVFRRSSEVPLYRIVKDPSLARRQGMYSVIAQTGLILKRGHDLGPRVGRAHDAVTTRSAEAQAMYDQGLAYLHAYIWIEAARSFNQALRLDPGLALAHVGLSFAYAECNKPEAARAAFARAQALAKTVAAHDRLHIDARAAQLAAEHHARADAVIPIVFMA